MADRFVPKTGFEPAHPFGRHHLKVVRLPISPPGQILRTISKCWSSTITIAIGIATCKHNEMYKRRDNVPQTGVEPVQALLPTGF